MVKSRVLWAACLVGMSSLQASEQQSATNEALTTFCIGAVSGSAGMLVYAPFHYFQNRHIQKLPIIWEKPHYWFRGAPSLVIGKAPALGVQISTYEAISRLLKQDAKELTYAQKTQAATIAGVLSGMVHNATHLIALQQENSGKTFAKTIVGLPAKQEIVTRGLGTTLAREAIFANVFLVVLQALEKQVKPHIHNETVAQVSSGVLTGATIAGITQPFMVVTAKLYADMEKKQYRNGFDAAYKIVTEEGVRGFYKGSGYRSIGVTVAIPVFNAVNEYFSGKK